MPETLCWEHVRLLADAVESFDVAVGQNRSLVNGTRDSNLRSPGGLILTHTHVKLPDSAPVQLEI